MLAKGAFHAKHVVLCKFDNIKSARSVQQALALVFQVVQFLLQFHVSLPPKINICFLPEPAVPALS